MKKAVPPNSQYPQSSALDSSTRSLRQTGAEGRAQGSLGQLAAAINQSPHVQTQLKLAEELQGSSQVQKNIDASTAIQAKQQKPAQMAKPEKKKTAQGKFDAPAQMAKPEKKKTAQGRFNGAVPAQLKEVATPNRTGLPDQLKAGVESLSGISMNDVKVHYNSDKPAQLNALAYAQGTDIHVGPGQEKHLPHEAWHIVQQKQGRVQPTTQMKTGVPINDDHRLEREADVMGAKALQRFSRAAGRSDFSLQSSQSGSSREEDQGHGDGCTCSGCAQAKASSTQEEETEAELSSIASGAAALQPKANAPIQMVCPECGKKKGHLSGCSRNKHNRHVKSEEHKQEHQESSSWENMQHYRPGWVRDNEITEEMVRAFCKATGRKIRGHHSEDSSQKEHKNTTTDLNAYKSWHTKKFKSWK